MNTIDNLWIILTSIAVIFMQAGFLCLEAGFVRSKNRINVALKNLCDFLISSVCFTLIGSYIMFKTSIWTLEDLTSPESQTLILKTFYQMTFAGTASTIISGAIAERMKFNVYLLLCVFTSILLYPIIGRWAWGDLLGGSPGWLQQLGFKDFAGSTVVHVVGGAAALATTLVVGPRMGRFSKTKSHSYISNDPTFASLGILVIWLGWFGFNGGSASSFDEYVPLILINTLFGGSIGGIVSGILVYNKEKKLLFAPVFTGIVAGLVSITGGAQYYDLQGAVIIASIGSALSYYSDRLLQKLHIDDVVGAIPSHLFAGLWGTVALAIFIVDPSEIKGWADKSLLGRVGIQSLGTFIALMVAFLSTFIFLKICALFTSLRVSAKDEHIGLNVTEHGSSTETLQLIEQMKDQAAKKDFSEFIEIDASSSEAGQIGHMYNHVISKVNELSSEELKLRKTLEVNNSHLELQKSIVLALSKSKTLYEGVTNITPIVLHKYGFLGFNLRLLEEIPSLGFSHSAWQYGGKVYKNPEIDEVLNIPKAPWNFKSELFDQVLVEEKALVLSDPKSFGSYKDTIKSIVAIPFFLMDNLVGTVEIYSKEKIALCENDKNFIDTSFIKELSFLYERERNTYLLTKSAKESEIANRAKSDFLAMMSHEIRTPMNGVIGMTDLLSQTSLSEEQLEYSSAIKESADALLRVINDILDYSKYAKGNLELESENFYLKQVIEGVTQIIGVKTAEKNIDLLVDVSSKTPEIFKGDALRLRQVLLNLLGNALKFTDSGEVLLSIEPLEVSSDNLIKLLFKVTDSGIGIPEDKVDSLFDSFSQADTSTTRQYGGTGLGLAISRQLVQYMKGEIWVENNSKGGATFSFTAVFEKTDLKNELIKRAQSKQMCIAGVANKRALVIDDNATNQKILKHQLRNWTVKSDHLDDSLAIEGLLATESTPYDLIICDYLMPGRDGFEAAKILRNHDLTKNAAFILLSSAHLESSISVDIKKQTLFDRVLKKPYHQLDLLETLHDLVKPENKAFSPSPTTPEKETASKPSSVHIRYPLNILFVDDNAMNRKLGVSILKRFGYSIKTANDGQQALDLIQAEDFDLVFMDIEMPIMDGLTTIETLREMDEPYRSKLVVAVTAAAMVGDKERCLAAGMSDYITKPIKGQDLLDVIKKYYPTISEQKDTFSKKPPSIPKATSKEPCFKENLKETVEGDPHLFQDLKVSFLQDLEDAKSNVAKSLISLNWDELHRHFHTLRPNAHLFGINSLSQLCETLEKACQERNETSINENISEFYLEIGRAKKTLNSLLSV